MHRLFRPTLPTAIEQRTYQSNKTLARLHSTTSTANAPKERKKPSTNTKDRKLTKKYTSKLIDFAAKEPKDGWRHMETLRGDEKRMKAAVEAPKKNKAPQVMSLESIKFQSSVVPEVDEDGAHGMGAPIEPGTFLEIRRNEQCTHGVVLGEEFLEGVMHVVTLVSSGEVWKHFKDDIMFTIPNLAPPDLISRCGPEEVAMSPTAVNARVEVLRRVRELERSVESTFNILGRRSHTIYPQVKSPDPAKWAEVTVEDVVRLLTTERKPSAVTTFAVHKHLMEQHKEFVADPHAYRTTRKFAVRPEAHIRDIETVVDMIRQPNGGPVDGFASRARKIIEANRKIALESFNEPPQVEVGKVALLPEDEVIVRFLLNSVRSKRTIQADPYVIGTSFIVKKLGVFPGTVDDDMIYRTLVDLGVLAPWQDLVSRRLELKLDQSPEESSLLVTEQNRLVEGYVSSKAPAQLSLAAMGPEDFYRQDLMESVRHDFGDQTVYVIDDVGAQELDDGISYEPIPSEPGMAWVHVHIADPTAVLPPTHIFARQARSQLETAYFLHRTWPMLPRSLMKSKLSLGVGSANGEPERVMSFSFKVDQAGDIADYKVRAGLVRNVKIVKYDAFDAAIGETVSPLRRPFGLEVPRESVKADSAFVNDFMGLKEVANRLLRARLKTDSFTYSLPSALLSLGETPTIPEVSKLTDLPQYRGFPNVDYTVSSFADTDSGSRGIVSEMMKAAGRVASRFCLERGVPALRRSLGRPVVSSEETMQKLLALRDDRGQVDSIDTTRANVLIPPATYTLEPGMHWAMGVPEGEGYLRVTSPLRRFSDMVWHWQIKHALLPSSAPLYFNADRLGEFATELSVGERIARGAQRSHKQFWALAYIQRWMNDPGNTRREGGPLEDLVAFSTSEPALNLHLKATQCRVHIPALGVEGFIRGVENDLPMGSVLKVRIEKISLGVRPQLEVALR